MNYNIETKQEEYVLAALAEETFGRNNLKPCELEHLLEEVNAEPERESTTSNFSNYLV